MKTLKKKIEEIVDDVFWYGESCGGEDYGTENYSVDDMVDAIIEAIRERDRECINKLGGLISMDVSYLGHHLTESLK